VRGHLAAIRAFFAGRLDIRHAIHKSISCCHATTADQAELNAAWQNCNIWLVAFTRATTMSGSLQSRSHSQGDRTKDQITSHAGMRHVNPFLFLLKFEPLHRDNPGNVCLFCRHRGRPKWRCQVCLIDCCVHRRAPQADHNVVCKRCREELLTDIRAFLQGQ